MIIASVGRALPRHRFEQAAIRARLQEIWADHPTVTARLPALHENARVRYRSFVLPLESYGESSSFGATNDAWIHWSQELGEASVRDGLVQAGLRVEDVDAIFTVSITGVACPSLDARLMNRMEFRQDVKRIPIFGLGCSAGVAGIARAAEYVKAFPEEVAVLLSVELCSLTFQGQDRSVANLISAGLFGDGAAAVVLVGADRSRDLERPGPRILDTRSVFYRDTEDLMGWRVSERGFEIVLSPSVPAIAREALASDVAAFLARHGLTRDDIATWVCHPGGPKVLQAVQDGLELTERDVALSWRMLEDQGNLSSASALMVLRETLAAERPPAGAHGLLLAMGPGFCSELVLLEW